MNGEAPRIILLAHGSSDERWCRTFEALATPTLESVPGSRIAYMELAEPSLDVPAMIEGLQSQHEVSITLAPPIGENPELGKAIRDVVIHELDSHKQPA